MIEEFKELYSKLMQLRIKNVILKLQKEIMESKSSDRDKLLKCDILDEALKRITDMEE